MVEMRNIKPEVFTPRLLDKLRSGVVATSATPIQVLIKFNTDSALDKFVATQGGTATGDPERRLKIIRVARSIRVVTVEVRVDVLGSLSMQSENLGIQNIDENFHVRGFLQETRSIEHVNAAWDVGVVGNNVLVGIIDTGIDDHHPDLVGVVSAYHNFTSEGGGDSVGHGTHVASIVAGRGNADPNRKGLAPGCRLLDAKVLGSDGFGNASSVIAAIEWCVEQKADVINLSLGASGPFDGTDALSQAANWAVSQGSIVCAAAGNCGPGGSILECVVLGDKTIATPGCAADVITVGAVDKTHAIADYSSRGPTFANLPKPDIVTVGSRIAAARAVNTSMGSPVDSHYTVASGTSMATPVCSAVVALLLDGARRVGRKLDPAQVKDLLRNGAELLPGVPAKDQGFGFVDVERVLAQITGGSAVLEIVSFAPDQGHDGIAGQAQTWILTVRNASTEALSNVEAVFSPADLFAQTAVASVGALAAGQTGHASLTVMSHQPFEGAVRIRMSYRTGATSVGSAFDGQVHIRIRAGGTLGSAASVDTVLNDAVRRLISAQQEDGTWAGFIMYNAWTNGMFCIMHRVLGLPGQPTRALDWLESHRNGLGENGQPDGTWGVVDEPSLHFLEASIAAEIALEIWGRGRRQEVWDFIDKQATGRLASAISLVDPFTQMFAALASPYAPPGALPYYSVTDILAPPLELLLVPRFLSSSRPKLFAAWGQDAIIALMAMTTIGVNNRPSLPKRILLKDVEAQLLSSQNADGSWYDTFLPTVACTMGMFMLGYGIDHPVMQRAIGFLQRLQNDQGYVARYSLPVWDTCIAVIALRTAGVAAHNPFLQRAGDYLIASQSEVDGGIPFTTTNVLYPDCDDTAFALLALNDIDMGEAEAVKQSVMRRAMRWLVYMQGERGGWAAFSKDQSLELKGRIPFFKNDPATPDVTGHVLSSLKVAPFTGEEKAAEVAKRQAIVWLQQMQMSRGEWFGRWGLTYTYGTAAVLQGMYDVGESMNQDYIRFATEYLLNAQQSDGGWGEGFDTYYNPDATERVDSTIDQTAWSIIGLLAVPQTPAVAHAVERGISFLLDKYHSTTGWPPAKYTVGALWIYKNTLYPLLWGVWALALYRKQTRA